jgi:hypothetical protein
LLSAKSIAPGQNGQIEASVKTEGVTGKVSKTVTVKSNDPRQHELQLQLTATVEPELTLSVRTIYFGSGPKGKEVTKELLITIPPERTVKVLGAESTDQNVSVKLEQVPGSNGKQLKVVAVQKADAKEGYHVGNLVIKTTSTLTPEIKVPVRGMVTPAPTN